MFLRAVFVSACGVYVRACACISVTACDAYIGVRVRAACVRARM